MTANLLLDHEATLRALEQDEIRRATEERIALAQPLPPPARVKFVLRRGAQTDAQQAIEYVERWWRARPNKLGRVTNAEIAALVRRIRGIDGR